MMGMGHFEFSWLWTSLLISGVLTGDWVVRVPVNPIHALQGSSVMLPCTYDFPEGSGPYRVLSEMWCLNQSLCITPNYVYHSAGIFPEPAYRGRAQYLGTLGSKNCSIRIDNLRMTDSGVYVFRFITTHPDSKLPIQRGVTLQVTAAGGSSLKVVGILVGIILALLAIAVIAFCIKRHMAAKSHQRVLTDDINL